MMTPFSGLSLFIHLAIIGIAALFNKIRGQRQLFFRDKASRSHVTSLQHPVISVSIVVFISTVMLSFAFVAVRTGVREGMDEPQIQFLHHSWEDFVESKPYYYIREYPTPITQAQAAEREVIEQKKQSPYRITIQPLTHSSLLP